MITARWLEELGAVRPMAPEGQVVLVLGDWHAGYYPIRWSAYRYKNGESTEFWDIFGIRVNGDVTKQDCLRILAALQAAKGGGDA